MSKMETWSEQTTRIYTLCRIFFKYRDRGLSTAKAMEAAKAEIAEKQNAKPQVDT